MNKAEFITCLSGRLGTLPQSEIEKSVSYYTEMIDDRVEDGMDEEAAVTALGNIDDIVREAMLDLPLPTLMKAKMKPKQGLKAWEIVLIILGFPLWLPLLMAFFMVILSVYIAIWSVIISLYAGVLSLFVGGIAGFLGSFFAMAQNLPSGLTLLGGSLVCLGLGIPAFVGVQKLAVWLVHLTGRFLRFVKSLFIKVEPKA
ncbi:DUF1700 domain-containing protein [Acetanaerobacterium elongatum]|uniref:Uncharacterized membrane protein n=1 Tax=Acetanaerobacterium elongatum TaxID=258515 RepID=A0A1H0BP43_9FIRM|nr:DUF1700 domain-containing protein [Acetanaerobacterium elongatum]SDN47429.1 Uncharacterized membrane protein [Acetanaerobacterium elongatum]